MLYTLFGQITLKKRSSIILEVNQIGYQIFLLPKTLKKIQKDQKIKFFIYHHINENSQTLYGFFKLEEREMFELLNYISGIGPKKALEILNRVDWKIIYQACLEKKAELLESSGLTSVMAEKIINGLKRRIKNAEIDQKNFGSIKNIESNFEAVEALKGLGYREGEVNKALTKVDSSLKIEEKIKECLKILS